MSIIVELSQNHDGDVRILEALTVEAARAGAQYCKIQSFFADDLSQEWVSDHGRMKKLELDWGAHAKFVGWCQQLGMIPVTSVYTFDYADKIWASGFKHVKIGSAQAKNERLIRQYMMLGFKVFLSTGGHKLSELPRLHPLEGVFHCVSQYPTPPNEANLTRMLEIKKWFPAAQIGFSSHIDPTHPDWAVPLKLASYLGAKFLEVHFTIHSRDQTKDGCVSLDPKQLKEICDYDRLPEEEKKILWFGMLKSEQTDHALIRKYAGRWQ